MKGSVVLEVAAMAIIAVVVIFVLYNLLVASPTNAKPPSTTRSVECKTSTDCIGKSKGKICIEAGIPIPTIFCGCMENSDCSYSNSHRCGSDNKCY